jgi:hypothetical protein
MDYSSIYTTDGNTLNYTCGCIFEILKTEYFKCPDHPECRRHGGISETFKAVKRCLEHSKTNSQHAKLR